LSTHSPVKSGFGTRASLQTVEDGAANDLFSALANDLGLSCPSQDGWVGHELQGE
jgi:hypothetical protein